MRWLEPARLAALRPGRARRPACRSSLRGGRPDPARARVGRRGRVLRDALPAGPGGRGRAVADDRPRGRADALRRRRQRALADPRWRHVVQRTRYPRQLHRRADADPHPRFAARHPRVRAGAGPQRVEAGLAAGAGRQVGADRRLRRDRGGDRGPAAALRDHRDTGGALGPRRRTRDRASCRACCRTPTSSCSSCRSPTRPGGWSTGSSWAG